MIEEGSLLMISAFYEERALVLGRLKHHEQVGAFCYIDWRRTSAPSHLRDEFEPDFKALTIYTSILNDFDAAEEYCQLYHDENDEANSQVRSDCVDICGVCVHLTLVQVYLQLFRAYVCPSDPMIAGLLEKELPTPEPDIRSAIKVLSRHASKIDTGRWKFYCNFCLRSAA